MRTKKFLAIVIAVLASLVFVNTASAYCGPGFSSKKSAIKYYNGAGKKFLPSLKSTLVKHGLVQGDEDIMSFLKSDRVVYTKTPAGYTLDWNTLCKGTKYQPFKGNLKHSKRGVLAIRSKGKPRKTGKPKVKKSKPKVTKSEVQEPQADGSIKVFEVTTSEVTTTTVQQYTTVTVFNPFMKDYCRNASGGDKWKVTKKSSKKSKKKKSETSKRLVRTIPPQAKNGTTTPPPPVQPTPTKNGTQTPATPSSAPGANPAPADTVSSKCYDEVTGQPVNPMSDGRCPVGSYGA